MKAVVYRAAQLLRESYKARLESMPLEIVRNFIEDYVCRMNPFTGERLEKLIS